MNRLLLLALLLAVWVGTVGCSAGPSPATTNVPATTPMSTVAPTSVPTAAPTVRPTVALAPTMVPTPQPAPTVAVEFKKVGDMYYQGGDWEIKILKTERMKSFWWEYNKQLRIVSAKGMWQGVQVSVTNRNDAAAYIDKFSWVALDDLGHEDKVNQAYIQYCSVHGLEKPTVLFELGVPTKIGLLFDTDLAAKTISLRHPAGGKLVSLVK